MNLARPSLLILVFLLPTLLTRSAEPLPEDRGAAALWQDILKLRTTASAIHITAHPDDEDAALITCVARVQGARTMLLSLTRGEGGANIISHDFFDALGILRTLEMLEADRHYGVEHFFTRAVDYGYSKVLDEALKSWGGEEQVLEDVVRVVRRERPDVIIARFRGDPRDGHGHHMFSGVMAQRVFDAAADPKRFPDQIAEGLRPWQARKLYAPASRSDPPSPGLLVVETGDYDPLLGRSPAQIAREGYSLHRSQGMSGRGTQGGPQQSRYRLTRSADPAYKPQTERSPFEGIDTSIAGIARRSGLAEPPEWLSSGLVALSESIETARAAFDALMPAKIAPPLVAGLKTARKLIGKVRDSELEPVARDQILFLLARKEDQLQSAIVKALAIEADASTDTGFRPPGAPPGPNLTPPFADATPGQTFSVRVRVLNRSPLELKPMSAALLMPVGSATVPEGFELKPIGFNETFSARFSAQLSKDAAPTRPYWHRGSIEETLYTIDAPRLHTLPLPPPPFRAVLRLQVLEEPVEMSLSVLNTFEDPALGSQRIPLVIVPPISVSFSSEHGIVPIDSREYRVEVAVRSSAKGPAAGEVVLKTPEGWVSSPRAQQFSFTAEGEEALREFTLSLPAAPRLATYTLEAVATSAGREYREGWTSIAARDVGRFCLYRPARHSVRAVDVKVASGLSIAYAMGSGDEVPKSLECLGVHANLLSTAELAGADLSRFDAVIIGVRAYAVRPELKTHNQRLLDYARDGGILIVQYQTPEYDHDLGPYPYSMSDNPEEVSEQDSPLTILAPESPIFTTPNRITPADFDGWVEERGSKFWKSWDDRYTPLLETHDTGQEPQKGGMLFTRYGKGAFVYSAYAWYRQLPHGVPGAFRIYANLISLRKTIESTK